MNFPYAFWSNKGGVNPTALANSLIYHYKLDSNGNDTLGSYNLTTLGSPTFAPGILSNSASCTTMNNNHFIGTTGGKASISGAGMSFSMWISMDASAGTDMGLYVSKCYDGYFGITADEYMIFNATTPLPDLTFRLYDTVGNYSDLNWGATILQLQNNTYYFVSCVVDTASTTSYIYVNNAGRVSQNYTPALGTLNTVSAQPFRIGGNKDFYNWQIANRAITWGGNCKVDDVAIWNRPLTSGEVLYLYNNGLGRTYPF